MITNREPLLVWEYWGNRRLDRQNLLALKGYHSTKIISFRAFAKVLQEN